MAITSSFYLPTSNNTGSNASGGSSTTTTGVANIQNFQEVVSSDNTIVITDDSQTLSKVISNMITLINADNQIEGNVLISNDDISITENDDSNEITIQLPDGAADLTAIFSMF